jgi:hypothetical protein
MTKGSLPGKVLFSELPGDNLLMPRGSFQPGGDILSLPPVFGLPGKIEKYYLQSMGWMKKGKNLIPGRTLAWSLYGHCLCSLTLMSKR